MKMRHSYIASVIIALLFSYSSAQSQMTTAEKALELEQSVIPHLKILLKDNYDEKVGFIENVLKVPMMFNGQAADLVLDEIVAQIPTDSGWENFAKESYTYNNQMLLRNVISSIWNGTAWENFFRFSFIYNAAEDITEVLFEFWVISSWSDMFIFRFTFNDSGNQIELLTQLWDGTSWINDLRITTTYTVAELTDIELSQDWVVESWVDTSQNLYSYVGATDTLQQIIRQLRTADLWVNDVLNSYTFDSTGNVIEIEYFINGPSGDEQSADEFFKVERDVWVYSTPTFINEFRKEKWIAPETAPGFWEDSLRTTAVLDSTGTILWRVSQLSVNSEWTNVSQTTEISTGPTGNLQEVINDLWETDAWVNILRSLYSYKIFVSVVGDDFIPEEFRLSQNYPNPFNPETTISFDLQRSGHTLLTVFNLKGEEVARLADGELNVGSHLFRWDASRSASGVYFYQLKQNGTVATKKMLLLK